MMAEAIIVTLGLCIVVIAVMLWSLSEPLD